MPKRPAPGLTEIEIALVRAAFEALGQPHPPADKLVLAVDAVHTELCRLFPGINGLTTPRDFSQTT